MIEDLSLPFNLSVIFFPMLFLVISVIAYVNYDSARERTISRVQNTVTGQIVFPKKSAIHCFNPSLPAKRTIAPDWGLQS